MSSPGSTRRYKNPPIEEALVEFQLEPAEPFDVSLGDKLRGLLHDDYPGQPRHQKLMQASIEGTGDQPTSVAVQHGIARVQLPDASGKRLISIGENVVSIHQLRPYASWEHFRPRIERGLRAYAQLRAATRVRQLGVRYINRIELPVQDIVPLEQYFTSPPGIATGLPTRLGNFLNRLEYAYDDHARLLVTFANLPTSPTASVILDIDVVWRGAEALDLDAALLRMDDLHQREGEAFEALITDKTREAFNG